MVEGGIIILAKGLGSLGADVTTRTLLEPESLWILRRINLFAEGQRGDRDSTGELRSAGAADESAMAEPQVATGRTGEPEVGAGRGQSATEGAAGGHRPDGKADTAPVGGMPEEAGRAAASLEGTVALDSAAAAWPQPGDVLPLPLLPLPPPFLPPFFPCLLDLGAAGFSVQTLAPCPVWRQLAH